MLRALRAESALKAYGFCRRWRPVCARPAQPWDGQHGRNRV